jgi:membrane protein YdbS with pleckstrin-like domain
LTLPAEEQDQRLDPRFVTAQRVAGAIFVAIVAGGLLLSMAIWLFAAPPPVPAPALVLPGAWLLVSAAIGALVLGYPALAYRHTLYRVDPQGFHIRRGVLWRSIVSVPRSRVQHTDVSQGPIERLFELATLVVYTAGTQHASVSLSGLSHATALRVRDHLLDVGVDDAV